MKSLPEAESPLRIDGVLAEMRDQLQPLRFAAGERVQRLAQPDVTEPDFIQDVEAVANLFRFSDLREELDRLAHRHLEDVVNGLAVKLDPQDVRLGTVCLRIPRNARKDRSGTASRSSRSRCRNNARSGRLPELKEKALAVSPCAIASGSAAKSSRTRS